MKPNPATQALRTYLKRVGLSVIGNLLAAIVIPSLLLLGRDHQFGAPWHTAVAALPIIPNIYFFVATVRFVRATDELKRRIIVNTFAIAGGVNIFFTETCVLLAVNPSAVCTLGVFVGSALIASVLLHRYYYYRCQ